MSPAESREPGMRWYGGLGADHGQKRELGGVTITRGDLTSPGIGQPCPLSGKPDIEPTSPNDRVVTHFGPRGFDRHLQLPLIHSTDIADW